MYYLSKLKAFSRRNYSTIMVGIIIVCVFILLGYAINGKTDNTILLEQIKQQQEEAKQIRFEQEKRELERQYNGIRFAKCVLNMVLLNQYAQIQVTNLRECTYERLDGKPIPPDAYQPYIQEEIPTEAK